jgi:hypothetical protein
LFSAERSRNRKPASHCLCIKYAHLPCEVRNRFRMTNSRRFRSNPGGTAEGSSTMSPFIGTFDNHDSPKDPRYGSHLAGDQDQLSNLQILIEGVSEGQLVVGNSLIHGIGKPHVSA